MDQTAVVFTDVWGGPPQFPSSPSERSEPHMPGSPSRLNLQVLHVSVAFAPARGFAGGAGGFRRRAGRRWVRAAPPPPPPPGPPALPAGGGARHTRTQVTAGPTVNDGRDARIRAAVTTNRRGRRAGWLRR